MDRISEYTKAQKWLERFEWDDSEETSDSLSTICEALQEIEKYRDAEEQGLLLRLPCKVGDTVWTNCRMQGWYFRLKDAPYRTEVVFVGLNDSEEMSGGFFNVAYENHGYMMQFNFSDIGKTVFLTKEAAEQALADMMFPITSE